MKKVIELQQQLERRILHGLSCQWDAALWVLNAPHRDLMKKPLFRLKSMSRRLGYWSSEKGEICLARDLVLNHSWESVCEVLIHEMAHQLSDQLPGADGEPPHGPGFLKACRLLRANPKASGEYPPLDHRLTPTAENQEDKTLIRIKKLMALAQSQNPHEAEAAMIKAHELVAKYNIDLIKANHPRRFVSVFVGQPALRRGREAYHLARLLQEYCFVYGLWVPAYVMEKAKMGRVLEISGTLKNITIARYIHEFVTHYIDTQWRAYNQSKRLNRHRKTDFAVGVIEGFREKMNARPSSAQKPRSEALVKVEDPRLKAYAAYKYPRTRTIRRKGDRNPEIFDDGIIAGKKMVIHKGIRETGGGERRLIGRTP